MTKRLSNALKKKLELSLTSLTARQSGRLYLIYANEWHLINNPETVNDYPPVAELMAAWDKRIRAAKSKKGEEVLGKYDNPYKQIAAIEYLSEIAKINDNIILLSRSRIRRNTSN